MSKKLLSILLAIAMVLTIAPVSVFAEGEEVASGTCGDDLIWVLYDDGELVISGSGDMTDFGLGSAPWYPYGESITKVTIENGVTSIGDEAFSFCTSLESITVSEDNEYYSSDEYGVLFNKNKTELVRFSEGNSRTEYIIPDSVTSVGDYAFSWCRGLTSITIPDGVTSIGNHAFEVCTSLADITIPDSVISIDDFAFERCPSLVNITIGNSVTSIGEYAFGNCTGLSDITIPDSVTSLGMGAFYICESLESITIPANVTSIGSGAFADCKSLTRITVCEDNEYYSSDEYGVLFNKNKTELIKYPQGNSRTEYTIPDSVTSICGGAFEDCSILESVTIPDSVTYIGNWSFYLCTNLVSMTIPDSVISIGNSAFSNCTSLESVTVGNSVTNIGENAFSNCTSLENIEVPDSVTYIGDWAFANCLILKSITILNSECEIYDSEYTVFLSVLIYGYTGSTAEAYAETYGRTFVALDAEEEPSTEEPVSEEVSTGEPESEETSTDELTTAEPTTVEPTTSEPTTAIPTTAIPETTTKAPETTTSVPETTTVAEETTTSEPVTEEPTTEEVATDLSVVSDSEIKVDNENKYAEITAGTSLADVLVQFTNEKVVIFSADNEELAEDALVGTGCIIKVMNGENVVSEYTVIVPCAYSCIFEQIMIGYNQLNKLEFGGTI